MNSSLQEQENFIVSDNLSLAWAAAFLQVRRHSHKEVCPLLVRITGFDADSKVIEDNNIRRAADACLEDLKEQSNETVANTIFPQSIYEYADDRHELYVLYQETMPQRKALARSKNGRGLYFERLIDYGSGPGNQLEFIIERYNKKSSVRRSMLQASLANPSEDEEVCEDDGEDRSPAAIFDPGRDHTVVAQLGFPCLQHVSFVPNNKDKTLSMNAFYATQQIIPKAYGNFLGLSRLGRFMAKEMNLRLAALNCFIGIEKQPKETKFSAPAKVLETELAALLALIKQ